MRNGDHPETSDAALAEAHPDTVATAGNQAAADVNSRAGRYAQPGSRRESLARRSNK